MMPAGGATGAFETTPPPLAAITAPGLSGLGEGAPPQATAEHTTTPTAILCTARRLHEPLHAICILLCRISFRRRACPTARSNSALMRRTAGSNAARRPRGTQTQTRAALLDWE